MKSTAREQIERPVSQGEARQNRGKTYQTTGQKYGLVHSSLLKWVSENKATDANKGEHDEPRKGCDQDYNCGIREHLNPPSRHA